MSEDCPRIDPLVTPYVDGALASADEQFVDRHLRICPPCGARVAAERAVRALMSARRKSLGAERAPESLRARCTALSGRAASDPQGVPNLAQPLSTANAARVVPREAQALRPAPWRARLAPLVLAASLVIVVGGAFVYQATARSSRLMTAELTADHVKCFAMNRLLGTDENAAAVEQAMIAGFGWRVRATDEIERAGLRLVGSRPCLYGEGRVAHLMYRHDGKPVSVFMLPNARRSDEIIDVLGHQAAVWSGGGRTFVLIARESRAEVERMASVVQAALR